MKVSPLSQGSGVQGADFGAASTGRSSPDRISAAKAIAAGESPIQVSQSDRNVDTQAERIQNIRKIKMRTNFSTDRMGNLPEDLSVEPQVPTVDQSATLDTSVQLDAEGNEVTKPLSPQFAALAKQRRALQVKEREIADREKALNERLATDGDRFTIEQIQADPLGIYAKAGVGYEHLTERLLNGEDNSKTAALEAKIAALEKGIDTKLSDRDTQAEQQALTEMRKEANALVINGDTYKYTRAMGKTKEAIDLIHKTWKQSGEVMDVSEALSLIEAECKNDYEELSKVLTPQEQMREQQQSPQNRQMRTLTNRDGASPLLDRRARAMAAFHGNKQR